MLSLYGSIGIFRSDVFMKKLLGPLPSSDRSVLTIISTIANFNFISTPKLQMHISGNHVATIIRCIVFLQLN